MYETLIRIPEHVDIDGTTAYRNPINDGDYALKDVKVEFRQEQDRLQISVTAEHTPVSRVRVRWHFGEKLRGKVTGDAWERAYADLEWKQITPWQTYPWYCLVNENDVTAGYGVMVRPGAICGWQLDPEGATLTLDVRNGGEGVELRGRTLEAATVVSRIFQGMNAFAAARAFCRCLCEDPIFPEKPVYGVNNWYYAYGRSSREDILADADYLVRLTAGAENRPYMVIDDGWQTGRYDAEGHYEKIYNGGPWIPNARFGDMKTLAEEIRKRDVLPGIWVRLLQDDLSGLPAEWKLPAGGLDPSIPGVLELVGETVRRIGAWGYRLLKHDFSSFVRLGRWGGEMTGEMAVY